MTYFPERYKRQLGRHHYAMIEAIYSRAKHGGRQAIAAPRGCGKSETVKGLQVYLVLAGLVRFPLAIAATTPLAHRLFKDFRKKFSTNQLLYEDFPEICFPVRDLDNAPQRAAKQHIDGALTQIVWTSDGYLSFPHVPGSIYGGVKYSYFGLDSAFRGVNIDGDRPDFIVIDDPETRESAKSLMQIEYREKIIDEDIAGLAEEGEELAIVALSTIQNRICLSYKLTDRDPDTGKPAFNGLRYGMVQKWPTTVEDATDQSKLGLWSDYITLRKKAMQSGDEHGLAAVEFYLANRDAMDAGAEMLSDHHVPHVLDDGEQVTYSALQVAFNKIADTSLNAYRSEYQNDPEDMGDEFVVKIKSHTVLGCESDFDRRSVAADCSIMVAGVDVRKTELHYVTLASGETVKNQIADYDVQSHGTSETTVEQAEDLILEGLHRLDSSWAEFPCVDTSGTARSLDLVLIDKGWAGSWKEDGLKKSWATQPVETFCLDRGLRRFMPAKGAPGYKSPTPSRDVIIGDNWHINRGKGQARKCSEVIWNAEHWHALVEDLFASNEATERFHLFVATDGVHKGHERLSQHIREGASDLLDLRRRGSATRKQRYRRDHWWDACAMALVAKSIENFLRDREANRKPKLPLSEMAKSSRQ